MKEASVNVLGTALELCSTAPVTGFFRNGCCDTGPMDTGLHTVCALMTAEFLALSKYLGNDLSTPRPEFGFAGLKTGDTWCLCAARFLQAHEEVFKKTDWASSRRGCASLYRALKWPIMSRFTLAAWAICAA